MSPPELTVALELASEAKARADKATEGPWSWYRDGCNCLVTTREQWGGPRKCIVAPDDDADADLIAHARTGVPALADAVTRLVERVRELEGEDDAHHRLLVRQHAQALQDHLLGDVDYWEDLGKLAARALDRIKELEGELIQIRACWNGEAEDAFDAIDEAVTRADQVLKRGSGL